VVKVTDLIYGPGDKPSNPFGAVALIALIAGGVGIVMLLNPSKLSKKQLPVRQGE
jgi:hypothetical protein